MRPGARTIETVKGRGRRVSTEQAPSLRPEGVASKHSDPVTVTPDRTRIIGTRRPHQHLLMYPFTIFLLLSLSAFALAADLYKILDLSRSASQRDIKHAYKKLSKKYHPDKNKDPDAKDKFVEIAHGARFVFIICDFSDKVNSIRGLVESRGG
jgi:hypothetical protein